ncbi:hypothetical protein [Parasitella parasitica]|uniref:RING-type domain-containing protein n=1 Tax=Parasitella parasitica TaxID=35722 RepID=A0A0B7NLD6_9FUNG|nr:hypothetical protein [Parasitella parasitica]
MEQSSSTSAVSPANADMNDTEAATAPSPRTVRTNWLRFSWNQISGASKVILLISFTLSIIQIAATITILAVGSNNGITCDKPLQLYLIIFVVRIGLSLPLSIYQHLFTPTSQRRNPRRRRRRRRGQGPSPGGRRNDYRQNAMITQNGESSPAINNTVTNVQRNNSQQESTSSEGEHQDQDQPASLISGWSDRIKSLLDLFAILWFIVGNYLIFSPSNCPTVAAPYYYTVLTWILLGYLILIIPLLGCAAVIFCLPCVLVALRTFSINVSNVMVGGTKEELAKIPVFKYRAPTTTTTTSAAAAAAPAATTTETVATAASPNTEMDNNNNNAESATNTRKPNFIRRIMRKQSYHSNPDQLKQHAHLDTITIPKQEDAICSICLGEYETDELICKLWQVYFCFDHFRATCKSQTYTHPSLCRCHHHYHKDCVHEWLALNSKCPLCKRDFRGKDYVDNSEESDDDEEQY